MGKRKNPSPSKAGSSPPDAFIPCIWGYYPVYFPDIEIKTAVPFSQELQEILERSPFVLVVNTKDPNREDENENFLKISILGTVTFMEQENDSLAVDVTLLRRVEITEWAADNELRLAKCRNVTETHPTSEEFHSPEFQEKIRKLMEAKMQIRELPKLPPRWFSEAKIATAIDFLAYVLNFRRSPRILPQLQAILEELNIKRRLDLLMKLLEDMRTNPDQYRTERAPAPNQGTPDSDRQKQYERIKDRLPEEANREILKEFGRLRRGMHPSEASMVQDHLDLLLELPWGEYTEDTRDLREVKRILDEDHWGLEDVKDRILEFIAVRQLNPSAKSPILCLVGPPGVGKTSLGMSIARALGRKFASLALGGMTDEAEIRGHRGTYINALPGKIIQEIKKCGSSNPVFMLDEVEKVGKDWHGDPAAALLEVLDPEQNCRFLDRYLDVRYDLSRVLFIATANIEELIHPTLKDRMEILELPGYTPQEKLHIAQTHLVKRRRRENGFPVSREDGDPIDIIFSDGAILKIIHQYTFEAGVRGLEREIDKPFRKVAKNLGLSDIPRPRAIKITEQNVHIYCGKPPIVEYKMPEVLPPGVVPILAVSDAGGHVFEIEVDIGHHPGGRKISMTGVRESQSDKDSVNKIEESLKTAFDALSMRGRILFELVRELEAACGPLFVEGHITDGYIPKDGPSAGISLFIAAYGALTGQSIKPTASVPLLGATGEITLNLNLIGVIGGIKDKILAAHRKGIKRLIIPKDNEADLEEVPEEILREMEIKPCQTMLEALAYAYPEDQKIKEYKEYMEQRGL